MYGVFIGEMEKDEDLPELPTNPRPKAPHTPCEESRKIFFIAASGFTHKETGISTLKTQLKEIEIVIGLCYTIFREITLG